MDTKEDKPLEIMKMMSWLGPKIVVITDGNKGAYAYNGDEAWFMPPYPDPKPPYERTGAGDAFLPPLCLLWRWAKLLKKL